MEPPTSVGGSHVHPDRAEDTPPSGWRPPILVWAWLAGDVIVTAAHVINATLVAGWAGHPLGYFDMDHEGNLPAWYATVKLATVSVLLAIYAIAEHRRGSERAWALGIPAAASAFMSLDEATQLHERLRPITRTEFLPSSGAWMLLVVPAFLAVVGLTVVLTRHLWRPRRARLLICAGVSIYVVAVGPLELAVNLVPIGTAIHQGQIVAEELAELVGVTAVLWAVLDILQARRVLVATAPRSDWCPEP